MERRLIESSDKYVLRHVIVCVGEKHDEAVEITKEL